MKKLIAALAIAATVLLVAGFVYVLMFMEDTENPPAGQSQSGGGSTSNARLNAPKAVETDADVELMREIGACVAQGYRYARPVPEEEFEKKLSKDQARL